MSGRSLVAGVDYPRDWRELRRWFVDESSCMGYLERLRWPEGPRCQGCGGSELWRMSDRALRCPDCRAETRLLAGSLFERSKLPLEIGSQRPGTSAIRRAG